MDSSSGDKAQVDNNGDTPQGSPLSCYDMSGGTEFNRTAFPFCYELLPSTYLMYWNHDVANNRITFGLVARTMGYLALGFSNGGLGMKGMDVAVLSSTQSPTTGGEAWKLEDR